MAGWGMKTQYRRPIGIDVGYDSIKMIQLVLHGGNRSVIAAEKVQLPSEINDDEEQRGQFVTSSIKQMVERGGFRGRDVILCLPNDKLKIISVRTSETEEDKINSVVRDEVAQRFGFESDEDEINYLVAGEVKQGDELKSELIVFAAEGQVISNQIKMLETARLRPVGIDTVACALFRNFCRQLQRQEDKEYSGVFVDIGSRFTTVVFSRGDDISFVKQIPIGTAKFNRQIAAKLGVNLKEAGQLHRRFCAEKAALAVMAGSHSAGPADRLEGDLAGRSSMDGSTRQVIVDSISMVAEELARELSLCFRYYTVTFRGRRVERSVFGGGGAYDDILLNILRQRLAVEVQIAEPLRGFDMMSANLGSDRRGVLCEWMVTVGVALKQAW